MLAYEAVREIVFQGYRKRSSRASVTRAYRALKALKLKDPEIVDALGHMDYADNFIKMVPALAAVDMQRTPEMTGEVVAL